MFCGPMSPSSCLKAACMEFFTNLPLIAQGALIFCLRIVDVSLGTIRTIMIVQGRTWISFCLGFFEVFIWLSVISTVVPLIKDRPGLIFFYALGFASGNFAGIKLERWMAAGHMILRAISIKNGREMAALIRGQGYEVTTFAGEGLEGPVMQLFIVCRRRDVGAIITMIKSVDPEAFYITERAGSVSKVIRPFMAPPTGWRAVLKKK
ncbi:Uncharacterized protein YebE, UPF0316 family [Desulfatibacillum alkenivorans DSM 16219]|uniref:Uncharacterized protein YebE, UPF0316 family n=2 Tax=Desulfatibacillum alkenivorans TaxID=259354 RepID=A0A1M6YQE1_9BACT|nr:Uncharacterized protein YebE, UPF0316 family [Desulfatibacillum alkenivorans DSM 16219]